MDMDMDMEVAWEAGGGGGEKRGLRHTQRNRDRAFFFPRTWWHGNIPTGFLFSQERKKSAR
jgi:hypothetical protein